MNYIDMVNGGVYFQSDPPSLQYWGVIDREGTLISVLRQLIFLALVVVLLSPTAIGQSYSVVDLGTLGLPFSEALDINNNGQIVGDVFSQNIFLSNVPHAFLYSGGIMTNLGALGAGTYSTATAINDRGQVVGYANNSFDQFGHAFLYNNGTMSQLAVPERGSYQSIATDINNCGQIAIASDGSPTSSWLYNNAGSWTGLGVLGDSEIHGINNSGQVVGESYNTFGGYDHAFLYSGGTMNDLGTLAGSLNLSQASAINDSGQVVGQSYVSGGSGHAFLYSGGKMSDLGTLPGYDASAASDINNAGQIVGTVASIGSDRAFLYSGGSMYDLNALTDASGANWTLTHASAINDAGQIVGFGNYNGKVHRAFVLIPNPKAVTMTPAPDLGYLTGTIDPSKAITVVITHGWEPEEPKATPSWASQMQNLVATNTSANAVTWTWPDAFTPSNVLTGLVDGEYATAKSEVEVEGINLARSLLQSGVKEVHFVGHSLGSYVNAYASQYLIQHGITVLQDAILDRPESNSAENQLFADTLTDVGWVDNYYGSLLLPIPPATGSYLPTASYNQSVLANHSGVHDYYASTIGSGSLEGFYWSVEGGGSLSRPATSPDEEFYVSTPATNFNTSGWRSTLGNSFRDTSATLRVVSTPAVSSQAVERGTHPLAAPLDDVSSNLWSDITVPADAQFMSFDMTWISADSGDQLLLQFGDQPLFNYAASSDDIGTLINSGPISVEGIAGQADQLMFTLNSLGDGQVQIANLTFSSEVPEPNMAVMCVVMTCLCGLSLRRIRSSFDC